MKIQIRSILIGAGVLLLGYLLYRWYTEARERRDQLYREMTAIDRRKEGGQEKFEEARKREDEATKEMNAAATAIDAIWNRARSEDMPGKDALDSWHERIKERSS